MLLSWFSLAYARVDVSDTAGCLDPDRVDNELRLQLGDGLVDRLDIQIRQEEVPDAATRSLAFRTTVREGEETLWSRTARFSEADCPAIPEAIALSVQQGLAQLSGWSSEPESRSWITPTMHLAISAGLPVDGRFGAHVGIRADAPGVLSFWFQARAQTGPPFEVGNGAATIVHPALAAGPVLRSMRGLEPEVWLMASGGPLFAFGSRFDTDRVATLPRFAVELGVGAHPGGPFQIGLFAEVPVLRVRLVETSGAGRTEAPVRMGLTVGLDFSNPQ